MAKKWMKVRVELVSGRGEDFDRTPGRVMVLPPATTFEQFGLAIDNAFARWDIAHLRMFRLADGTMISDEGTIESHASSPFGKTLTETAVLETPVNRLLEVGDVFEYVFDLGDDWTHACRVEDPVDPLEELGIEPDLPVSSWGWGTIPDQYGRESEEPNITALAAETGDTPPGKPLDRREFRGAVYQNSVADAIAAMSQADTTPSLQQVGEGLMRLEVGADAANCQSTSKSCSSWRHSTGPMNSSSIWIPVR